MKALVMRAPMALSCLSTCHATCMRDEQHANSPRAVLQCTCWGAPAENGAPVGSVLAEAMASSLWSFASDSELTVQAQSTTVAGPTDSVLVRCSVAYHWVDLHRNAHCGAAGADGTQSAHPDVPLLVVRESVRARSIGSTNETGRGDHCLARTHDQRDDTEEE